MPGGRGGVASSGPGSQKRSVFKDGSLRGILAIFYPPLKQIWGCVWLFLQVQEGNIYFTELAERVEYGNYAIEVSI